MSSALESPLVYEVSHPFSLHGENGPRRVRILLPPAYLKHGDRCFQVLYLQDGQNLFDPYAPFGNWGIDRSLVRLASKGKDDLIIVAIDHGGIARIREFSPYCGRMAPDAGGQNYIHFVADQLKPFIDAHYRTLPGREHTGIGGSSMGGLISLYAGLTRAEIFSKVLAFSPSLWAAPQLFAEADRFYPGLSAYFYLYGGGAESGSMLPMLYRMAELLDRKRIVSTNLHLQLSSNKRGRHNESRWGKEFPKAIDWLYFGAH